MVTRNNKSKIGTPRADKWTSKYWKVEPNITISEDTGNITFMCDRCNIAINPVPNDKDMWMCSQCKITFIPDIEQVKRDLPFSNPDEEDKQREPVVTSIGYEDYYGNLRPKKTELKGGFLALSKKGLRIKDYKEGTG